MAPDTPRRHLHAVPRYADVVPDGFTQIRKHPEPAPKPPTERGWWEHHEYSPIVVPHRLWTDAARSIQHYDHLVDPCAVDATFENEVRPR